MRELSGFLIILMYAATFPRSALMPVLSARLDFVDRYSLTSQVKRTASLLGLCGAQPSCRSLPELLAPRSCCCSPVDSKWALSISSLSTLRNFSTQSLLSLSLAVSKFQRMWQCSPISRWLSSSLHFLKTMLQPGSEPAKRPFDFPPSLFVVVLWSRAALSGKKFSFTTSPVGPWGLTMKSW